MNTMMTVLAGGLLGIVVAAVVVLILIGACWVADGVDTWRYRRRSKRS